MPRRGADLVQHIEPARWPRQSNADAVAAVAGDVTTAGFGALGVEVECTVVSAMTAITTAAKAMSMLTAETMDLRWWAIAVVMVVLPGLGFGPVLTGPSITMTTRARSPIADRNLRMDRDRA